MQMYMFARRTRDRLGAMAVGGNIVIIHDRGVIEDTIFANAARANGHMTPAEMEVYQTISDLILRSVTGTDSLMGRERIIYLNTTPAECKQRIDTRGRECEKGISLEYLQQLDDGYRRAVPNWGKHVTTLEYNRRRSQVEIDEIARKIVAGEM